MYLGKDIGTLLYNMPDAGWYIKIMAPLIVLIYLDNVIERYKLEEEQIEDILKQENQAENENIYEVMQLIGRKRGAMVSGGNIDDEKVANIILNDFRTGKIGRITLEQANGNK